MRNPEYFASVALAVVAAFIIAIWVPGDGAIKVKLAISYGGLVLLFLFGFMILAAIASGKIDISGILMEKGGSGSGIASMSRFQLMVFTFVIAMSFFLIVVSTGKFPEKIPPEVLTLLGISASTYAVSKGIQAGAKGSTGNGGGGGGGGGGTAGAQGGSQYTDQG
ncbi:MAG TPA: hypothetical protein VEV41_20345 [Terriglobales bacterium]|nr:hypothetical protein [Terriglobales bacterium]